ncbi:MAG: hypothetical protein EXQ56_00765 [Acidobacteria bacterium]|nr:hypothetical protein [Acidobacteriota bacterium]
MAQMQMGGPEAKPAPVKEEPPPPAPRVAVGEITGTPGSMLMLPLYYTPDPKMPVKEITVDIDFVSNTLKFQKLSPGVAAEESGADVKGVVTEGKTDDKGVTRSKLTVTAALPDAKAAAGLPDGLVAYLLFQVTLEAKPYAVRMNTIVTSAKDPASKPVKVNAQNGLVVMELMDMMPEATCFFFTH